MKGEGVVFEFISNWVNIQHFSKDHIKASFGEKLPPPPLLFARCQRIIKLFPLSFDFLIPIISHKQDET